MNNIELEVAVTTKKMNKAVTDKLTTIDWEQRRYETAKEVSPIFLADEGLTMEECAHRAVWYADTLIAKLKGE